MEENLKKDINAIVEKTQNVIALFSQFRAHCGADERLEKLKKNSHRMNRDKIKQELSYVEESIIYGYIMSVVADMNEGIFKYYSGKHSFDMNNMHSIINSGELSTTGKDAEGCAHEIMKHIDGIRKTYSEIPPDMEGIM